MSTRLLQCLTSFKNYIGQEGVNGEWTEKKHHKRYLCVMTLYL